MSWPTVQSVVGEAAEQLAGNPDRAHGLRRDGRVPSDIAVGDILATPVTGAYGHSMGSNYNKVPRPAVVFTRNGTPRLAVRRETHADLLSNDV